MLKELFLAFFTQILFTLGVVVLFGWLIALCNRRFYANMGRSSMTACYVTGFIGTPIHECAHALFCLIFGHKIHKIKLFQIDSADGTLGYVTHSYNKKNIYHQIGNFFIGVAPILVISTILYLLSSLLVPNMWDLIFGELSGLRSADGIFDILEGLARALLVFFTFAMTGEWWIFFAIGIFLALHMTLSTADIKNALGGIGWMLLLLFLVDCVLLLIGNGILESFTSLCLMAGGFLASMLTLSLVISLIAVLVSAIIKAIRSR